MSESSLPPIQKCAMHVPTIFVVGTDTAVGKTIVTCVIARCLADQGKAVRVFKPLVSGCERDEAGQLVGEDTVALQQASRTSQSLADISPLTFEPPLAPAAAAEAIGQSINWTIIDEAAQRAQENADVLLIEGVGGLLVPLDPSQPQWTVFSLAQCWQVPVLIVGRTGLGTLNHTAMTSRLLQDSRVPIAGVVLNQTTPGDAVEDPSVQLNATWIARMTGLPVLATLPFQPVEPQWESEAMQCIMREIDWVALAQASRA